MRHDFPQHLEKLISALGGKENIAHVTHCATRLRLVLKDNTKIQINNIEDLEKVKGVFTVGDQLQIIYGAGLVNEVCQALKERLTLDDESEYSSQQRQNIVQRFVKSISDVFVEIMPSILAAALLMGLTSLLTTRGIFGLLPMVVAWSATRRYGGRPALGLAIGAIMVHPGLVDAFSAASGKVSVETISLFGLPVELVGFQGGIIIALMIGFTVAWLDKFFNRTLPDIIKFVLSPMLTILLSSLLLFTLIGPVGRLLGEAITGSLLWMAEYLGIVGYMIFGAVQQLIVITGLHHTFGAIEGQLLASTGRDFLNPLMSVALIGQGGAVLGYMLLHRKDKKVCTLCVSAFTSILFGISEPALFGVTLKYRFPLLAGCVAGAAGAAWVYLSKLTAVGYGTTALPGITIVDPANNGHLNYILAHLIALFIGALLTFVFGKMRHGQAK